MAKQKTTRLYNQTSIRSSLLVATHLWGLFR